METQPKPISRQTAIATGSGTEGDGRWFNRAVDRTGIVRSIESELSNLTSQLSVCRQANAGKDFLWKSKIETIC